MDGRIRSCLGHRYTDSRRESQLCASDYPLASAGDARLEDAVRCHATVMISAAVLVARWSIRNTYVHGTFVLTSTQGGSEFNKGNNPIATGILAYDHDYFSENLEPRYPREEYVRGETEQSVSADAVNFIGENPGRFIELCFIRFTELWKLYSPRVP